GDHEVDEGVVRVAPVHREGGDPGAGDHGEGEERLPDDVAERLEAADPIADALEPTVRAHRVEREDAFPGHTVRAGRVARPARAVTKSSNFAQEASPGTLPRVATPRASARPPSAGTRSGSRSPRSGSGPAGRGTAGACPGGRGRSRTSRGPPGRS